MLRCKCKTMCAEINFGVGRKVLLQNERLCSRKDWFSLWSEGHLCSKEENGGLWLCSCQRRAFSPKLSFLSSPCRCTSAYVEDELCCTSGAGQQGLNDTKMWLLWLGGFWALWSGPQWWLLLGGPGLPLCPPRDTLWIAASYSPKCPQNNCLKQLLAPPCPTLP